MIWLFILTLSLLALWVDWSIYRRIARHTRKAVWKRVYLVYALCIDVSVGISLVFNAWVIENITSGMHFMMWIVYIFFLNTLPKFVYYLISLGDTVRFRLTHRRSRVFGWIGMACGLAVFLALVHGATIGRSHIRVERVELVYPDLPPAFDGLRIVLFSDTHIGSLVNRDRSLERLVDTVNALHPDLVVNAGDLVNIFYHELDPQVMQTLSGIRSKWGVYSILGNHDLGLYVKDTVVCPADFNTEEVIRRQQQMGWKVLVNESDYLIAGGDSIQITGLNYPRGYRHNGHNSKMTGVDYDRSYGRYDEDVFNITLSHAPQLWDEIRAMRGSDLTLSGHVHSMQLKFTIGKWRWSPAKFMYNRWSGLYKEGDKYLYINDGFGYVMYPLRIGTRPEVTLITLRRL